MGGRVVTCEGELHDRAAGFEFVTAMRSSPRCSLRSGAVGCELAVALAAKMHRSSSFEKDEDLALL
jgi:hypothetical protein